MGACDVLATSTVRLSKPKSINAAADVLEQHPIVDRVNYPAAEAHPLRIALVGLPRVAQRHAGSRAQACCAIDILHSLCKFRSGEEEVMEQIGEAVNAEADQWIASTDGGELMFRHLHEPTIHGGSHHPETHIPLRISFARRPTEHNPEYQPRLDWSP